MNEYSLLRERLHANQQRDRRRSCGRAFPSYKLLHTFLGTTNQSPETLSIHQQPYGRSHSNLTSLESRLLTFICAICGRNWRCTIAVQKIVSAHVIDSVVRKNPSPSGQKAYHQEHMDHTSYRMVAFDRQRRLAFQRRVLAVHMLERN